MEVFKKEEEEIKTIDKEQPDLNSWLPITASRKAKWWYSTFHNVTAMVGAGVLGLPFAMSQLGWVAGTFALFGSWVVTFYTLWQLVHLHEVVPGKRFDRYFELGMHAFGENLGYWIIMPQQLAVQVASNIVYMVTGGKSLKTSIELFFPSWDDSGIRTTYFIMAFGFIQLILSQVPNFNSLKVISLTAAVMSVCYSAIACGASLSKGITSHHHEPVTYGVRSETTAGIVFDVFTSMGAIAFAYAGHGVVLEIQATIPSTPELPSKVPMWRGVVVAYIIVVACYLSVAISGFWAFGSLVDDDVLITLRNPAWLIGVANFMVFLHVIGSYQVFAMPVFDRIETYLVMKRKYTPGNTLRLIARSVYVVLTAFVGIIFPFFGGLLGFFGGLAYASTSYVFPCIIWLVVKKPKRWSKHWCACMVSATLGIIITIVGPIGGARTIIMQSKTYKMFS